MKVLIKTKEQLLASGWFMDRNGNIDHETYTTIVPHMVRFLGKQADMQRWGGQHWQDTDNWVWGEGAIMTKQDIINEFFK